MFPSNFMLKKNFFFLLLGYALGLRSLSRSVFAGGSCHNNELWFPRIIFRNFIIRSRVVIQFQRSSFSDTAEGSAMEQLWVFGTSEVEKLHDAAADERRAAWGPPAWRASREGGEQAHHFLMDTLRISSGPPRRVANNNIPAGSDAASRAAA